MPKIRVDSRIESLLNDELNEFLENDYCPYPSKSDLVRDCIDEGFDIVKKRLSDGEAGRC